MGAVVMRFFVDFRPTSMCFSNGKHLHLIHNDFDLMEKGSAATAQVPDFFAWLWLLLLFEEPAADPPPSPELLFWRKLITFETST